MPEKKIVLTMYGKKETIESISISLLDVSEQYYSNNKYNALHYCENINDLELKDENWVYASIIGENEKVILMKPPKFDLINKLPDRSVQKLLREISKYDLARAIKDIDEKTREKVFKNMSKRSATMLKEDIESLRDIPNDEIKSSRKKITEEILRLCSTGEIVIARAEENL